MRYVYIYAYGLKKKIRFASAILSRLFHLRILVPRFPLSRSQSSHETGVGKLGRSKVCLGKLGPGKLGFRKVGRWSGELGQGARSQNA